MRNEQLRRWRLRLPRFSLRTLLVLFGATTILLAWKAHEGQRRLEAVALLTEWNLDPESDNTAYQELPWRLLPNGGYPWLRPWLSRFTSVEQAGGDPCGTSALDDWKPDPRIAALIKRKEQVFVPPLAERKRLVDAITRLPELEWLQVEFELDDEDLKDVASLKSLQFLGFQTSQLTEQAIDCMLSLPNLQRVQINGKAGAPLSVDAIIRLKHHPTLLNGGIAGQFVCDNQQVQSLKETLPNFDIDICSPTGDGKSLDAVHCRELQRASGE
jgi:hypothetical protein